MGHDSPGGLAAHLHHPFGNLVWGHHSSPRAGSLGLVEGGAVPADTRETINPSDGHCCLGHPCLLLDVRRQPNE